MDEELNLKESFENEIEKIRSDTVLSPEYRRKKVIIWAVRTFLAIVIYVAFWKHNWIRWTLIGYVPLNLLGLASIFGWNYFLNKRIDKTRQTIKETEINNIKNIK